MEECKTCGKGTKDYKCDMCDAESDEHDAMHACGGEHCMPKCIDCKKAETKCTC